MDRNPWTEYDAAAEWSARRGLKGTVGDPLPPLLAADVLALINDDPDAFATRVRETAYGLAMEKHSIPLCPECIGAIGGACGGPDAPYRPAHSGEPCGAADHRQED